MRSGLTILILTLLSVQKSVASADIENILVTGSRLGDSPAITTVMLSREDIDRINPISTTALLRQIPNVLVSENGGLGGQSFISIRGGEPNFTLVLIDGIAVNDPTNSRGGGFDFNQLDPATIERVEVYPGGASAIHGSDAISGVIHFTTRRTTSSELTVETGNDEQRRAGATIGGELSPTLRGILTFGTNKQSRSPYASYENHQLLGKISHLTARSDSTLLVSVNQQNAKTLPEDSGGVFFAGAQGPEQRESSQFLAGLRSSYQTSDALKWTGSLTVSNHQEDADHPGIIDGALSGIPPSIIRSDFRKSELELFATTQLADSWTLITGGNYQSSRGKNTGFLDFGFPLEASFRLEQDIWAVFAETSKRWNAANISLGLRMDAPKDFDREYSTRVTGSYNFGPALTAYFGYNEGYKLPSFFALAHPLVGNPALKPERSTNTEVGMKVDLDGNRRLHLTYFYNAFTDLVDFDPALFLSVNRSSVTAEGVELGADLPITEWFSAGADLSYLSTNIKGSNDSLRRRPRWSGSAHLQAATDPIDVRLSVFSRSEFADSSVPTGPVTLGGFTSIDLAINWRTTDQLTLTGNVTNLADSNIEEAVGFTDTGRQWRIGFRYRF